MRVIMTAAFVLQVYLLSFHYICNNSLWLNGMFLKYLIKGQCLFIVNYRDGGGLVQSFRLREYVYRYSSQSTSLFCYFTGCWCCNPIVIVAIAILITLLTINMIYHFTKSIKYNWIFHHRCNLTFPDVHPYHDTHFNP